MKKKIKSFLQELLLAILVDAFFIFMIVSWVLFGY